jgi:hypothetical protein
MTEPYASHDASEIELIKEGIVDEQVTRFGQVWEHR